MLNPAACTPCSILPAALVLPFKWPKHLGQLKSKKSVFRLGRIDIGKEKKKRERERERTRARTDLIRRDKISIPITFEESSNSVRRGKRKERATMKLEGRCIRRLASLFYKLGSPKRC